MASESGSPGRRTTLVQQPCPGDRVAAACDLPSATHSRATVASGSPGEIVRTPAYFCTTYSIKFRVHDKDITLHGINRHEFRIIGEQSVPVIPGYPPVDRYPQPRRPFEPEAGTPRSSPEA
jgi:hypothetical protein